MKTLNAAGSVIFGQGQKPNQVLYELFSHKKCLGGLQIRQLVCKACDVKEINYG